MFESLVFSLALSTHIGLDGEFNSVHPRVTYIWNDKIAGVYYNSESRPSIFVGEVYTTDSYNIEYGVVSGYSAHTIVPMVKFNYKNFFIAPAKSNNDTGIVTGIEVKF